MTDYRIGIGYDVHRLIKGRKLMLGCVEIPHHSGLLGHSDADVLCHAIADAMLGAAALGDIGRHFPDSDPAYEGMSGERILCETLILCKKKGYRVSNVDAVIIAQNPRLSPYMDEMVRRVSAALCVLPDQVNIKATTEEKLGFTGREEGIASQAVCLLVKE